MWNEFQLGADVFDALCGRGVEKRLGHGFMVMVCIVWIADWRGFDRFHGFWGFLCIHGLGVELGFNPTYMHILNDKA